MTTTYRRTWRRTLTIAAAPLLVLVAVAPAARAAGSPPFGAPRTADTTPPVLTGGPAQPLFVSDVAAQMPTQTFADPDSGVASEDVRFAGGNGTATAIGPWVYPPFMQNLDWHGEVHIVSSPRAGRTSCMAERARDGSGNVSAWSPTRCASMVVDDSALRAGAGWTAGHGPLVRFDSGTYSASSRRGATIDGPTVRARHVGVLVTTCPTCGSLDVYIGTHRIGTVSTRAAKGHYRVMIVLRVHGTPAYGRLRLVVRSSGARVIVDGLGATIV